MQSRIPYPWGTITSQLCLVSPIRIVERNPTSKLNKGNSFIELDCSEEIEELVGGEDIPSPREMLVLGAEDKKDSSSITINQLKWLKVVLYGELVYIEVTCLWKSNWRDIVKALASVEHLRCMIIKYILFRSRRVR